ncbi:MAG: hypothetical protein QW630_05315 [Sulfolobales archaeon]
MKNETVSRGSWASSGRTVVISNANNVLFASPAVPAGNAVRKILTQKDITRKSYFWSK